MHKFYVAITMLFLDDHASNLCGKVVSNHVSMIPTGQEKVRKTNILQSQEKSGHFFSNVRKKFRKSSTKILLYNIFDYKLL